MKPLTTGNTFTPSTTLLSPSIHLPSGREESASVHQGRLVSDRHIPCFYLSPPTPHPPASTGASTFRRYDNSALTSNSHLPAHPPALHPGVLFSTCDRTRPLRIHTLPMTGRVGGGGGVDARIEEGNRGVALQCFPFSAFAGSVGGAALKPLTSRGGVEPRGSLLAPFCLSSNWARSSRLPGASSIHPFILLVTGERKRWCLPHES